jgi:hypothetical protein
MDVPSLLSLAGAPGFSRTTCRNAPQQARLPLTRRIGEFYAARTPLPSAASVSARSVRSQVNSGSVRPKCP